jgi:hypothetical protein
MHAPDRRLKDARAPNLASSGPSKKGMARSIALDADCEQAASWVLDSEINAEGIAVIGNNRLKTKAAHVVFDRTREAI